MFGLSSRSLASAFVQTQYLPTGFHLSSDQMKSCASLRRRLKPSSQQATRSALLQRGKAFNSICLASFSGRNADSDLAGGGSSIPQPQASNAGSSSANTSIEAPTTASSNGAPSSPQADGQQHQQHGSSNSISDLQNDVSKLSELVTNQARLLQEQMKDLEQARSLIDMHAMTNTLSASAPTQTIKAGWDKDIKPFEVQRNAIGDRRYLGGYDARFHSTNKQVLQLCMIPIAHKPSVLS